MTWAGLHSLWLILLPPKASPTLSEASSEQEVVCEPQEVVTEPDSQIDDDVFGIDDDDDDIYQSLFLKRYILDIWFNNEK